MKEGLEEKVCDRIKTEPKRDGWEDGSEEDAWRWQDDVKCGSAGHGCEGGGGCD